MEYEDIVYQVGTYEGIPITETLTVEEQKDIERSGLSVNEVIKMNISAYHDWQSDC
jgi:hypothetical protein